MLVRQAIEMLNDFSPDEEIVFAFWTKRYVEYQNQTTISNDVWDALMRHHYKLDWSSINNQLDYIIDNAVEDEDEDDL